MEDLIINILVYLSRRVVEQHETGVKTITLSGLSRVPPQSNRKSRPAQSSQVFKFCQGVNGGNGRDTIHLGRAVVASWVVRIFRCP